MGFSLKKKRKKKEEAGRTKTGDVRMSTWPGIFTSRCHRLFQAVGMICHARHASAVKVVVPPKLTYSVNRSEAVEWSGYQAQRFLSSGSAASFIFYFNFFRAS